MSREIALAMAVGICVVEIEQKIAQGGHPERIKALREALKEMKKIKV